LGERARREAGDALLRMGAPAVHALARALSRLDKDHPW